MWGTAFFNEDLQLFDVEVSAPRTFRGETFGHPNKLALWHFTAEEQIFAFIVRDTGYFFLRILLDKVLLQETDLYLDSCFSGNGRPRENMNIRVVEGLKIFGAQMLHCLQSRMLPKLSVK